MKGTVDFALPVGCSKEQAELLGTIDDRFGDAVKVGLITREQAEYIGRLVGEFFLSNRHVANLGLKGK